MKKLLLLSFTAFSLLTGGCGFQDYVHTTEPRSTIYIGQTAADVYENFGMPTKIKRLGNNKQILIYHKQEIEKDWAYRYFHECELKFYMEDDRLVDWSKRGDMCAVKELSSAIERPYFNLNGNEDISYSDHLEINGNMIPGDAFGGAKIERETSFFSENEILDEKPKKSFFSGWFSNEDELEKEFPNEMPIYQMENKNRVFVGDGVPTGSEYQNNDLSYMNIPADAF
ncbi:MAG: hypothetical protein J6V53_02545 [Alphaproteobacteria bacterium]|nr:hypothetical protein [Alphaproteobacteria bacterium]